MGTLMSILVILIAIFTLNAYWLFLVPIIGYGFAWIGHFFFEKNKPATFEYPFYSLLGDLVLFKDMLFHRKK